MSMSRAWIPVLTFLLLVIGLSAGMSDDRVIAASEVLAKIKAGETAEFDNYTIVGDLNLSALKIEDAVHFNHTIFQNSVNFNYTSFNGPVYFWSSAFNGPAYFVSSVFNGPAYFDYSAFTDPAYFGSSAFTGPAYFGSSAFTGPAYFEYSDFNDSAYFPLSAFNNGAYFQSSAFTGPADFIFSAFNGPADFKFSAFNDGAYFQSSAFNGIADFSSSAFNGHADFRSSAFNDTADFRYSAFNDIADLSNSKLKGDAFFYGSTFKKELDLTLTEYNNLYIRWNKDNRLVYDDTAYQSLIENLRKLGFTADADNCYYQFRVGQFLHQNPIEDPLISIFNFGAWIFYGFGKRPIYPFIWSIFSVGLFGVFWIAIGLASPMDAISKYNLNKGWSHRLFSLILIPIIFIVWRMIGLEKSKRAIDEYDQVGNWPTKIREAFGFSATVFLSGTKFFVDPPVIPVLPGRSQSLIKRTFLLERLLGAFFSILLFLAVGATIVRN